MTPEESNSPDVTYFNWPSQNQPATPVVLAPQAQESVCAAYMPIKAESPARSTSWLNSIRKTILDLGDKAVEHPVAPETRLFSQEIREVALDDPALRILFRIGKTSIQVLDVQLLPG